MFSEQRKNLNTEKNDWVANLALEAERAIRHIPGTDRVLSRWQEANRIERAQDQIKFTKPDQK